MDHILPTGARGRQKVPAQPGKGLFQWMKIVNENSNLSGTEGGPDKKVSMEEVVKHNTQEDAWVVLKGIVYNVTPYLEYHPGGIDELLRGVGRDCTYLFDDIHHWVNIEGFLRPCRVGILDVASGPSKTAVPARLQVGGASKTPKIFDTMVVSSVTTVNYNSILIKCQTEKPISLQVGQHLKIQATAKNKLVSRPYTPINNPSDRNHVELLVKVYPDGALTPILSTLKVGDSVKYSLAKNQFTMENSTRHVGMIAGGTGITPMINVLRGIFPHKIKCTLLYVNVIEEDILLKEQLETWVSEYPDLFKVHYALTGSTIPESWSGLRGRPNADTFKALLPPPEKGTKILVCGPVRMTNSITGQLYQIGYSIPMVYAFA